jgi:hypothetical protein
MSMRHMHYPTHHRTWTFTPWTHGWGLRAVLILGLSIAAVVLTLSLVVPRTISSTREIIVQVQPVLQGTAMTRAALAEVCGPDFYLTGDVVGDANLAVILAALCARR